MTINLPPHLVAWIEEIVSAITRSQRRIGVEKLRRVLGELRSTEIALLGSRGLFSQMKEALCHVKGKRVTLYKGIHEALADFQ